LIGATIVGYNYSGVELNPPQKIVAVSMEDSGLVVYTHDERGVVYRRDFDGCVLKF